MASNTLPKRLRILRAKNDWTQADVAEKLGVSQAWISRFEKGVDVGEETEAKIRELVQAK